MASAAGQRLATIASQYCWPAVLATITVLLAGGAGQYCWLWCWPVLLAGGAGQWRCAASAKSRAIKNTFKHSDTQTLRHSDIQTFRHSHIQTLRRSDTQTLRHSDTQTFRHSDTREDTQQTHGAHTLSPTPTLRLSVLPTLQRCPSSCFFLF